MPTRYLRFALINGMSTAIMLVLMCFNTYALDHVFWSQTRFYMAPIMGAVMAVLMLLFMQHMYDNASLYIVIAIASTVVFGVALFLVRSQETLEHVSWMKAMMPHHTIEILTSRCAHVSNYRVPKLADVIISA